MRSGNRGSKLVKRGGEKEKRKGREERGAAESFLSPIRERFKFFQGSVSGPYLFNVFLNDLEIKLGSTPALFKYADDSIIISPVWKGGNGTSNDLVEAFLTWANCNSMSCNPNKCKKLVIKKKGNSTLYPVVRNVPQHATLDSLSLTFQNDCKFSEHIKAKLCKANKCLHVLRVCRKERYSQTEIDYLFYSIVLPNITYGLSVYGASDAEINVLQQFLDRCYKLRFISTQLNIRSLLQKQDKAIFQKGKQHDNHPLKVCLPQEKNNLTYNLRRKSFQRPKINTERYKNTFVNRLIFKYNLL